jgi:hypothetical protein
MLHKQIGDYQTTNKEMRGDSQAFSSLLRLLLHRTADRSVSDCLVECAIYPVIDLTIPAVHHGTPYHTAIYADTMSKLWGG